MTNKKQIAALRLTIKWFKKQIKPRDCGWMYSTIAGLEHRIAELRKVNKIFIVIASGFTVMILLSLFMIVTGCAGWA